MPLRNRDRVIKSNRRAHASTPSTALRVHVGCQSSDEHRRRQTVGARAKTMREAPDDADIHRSDCRKGRENAEETAPSPVVLSNTHYHWQPQLCISYDLVGRRDKVNAHAVTARRCPFRLSSAKSLWEMFLGGMSSSGRRVTTSKPQNAPTPRIIAVHTPEECRRCLVRVKRR